LKFRGQELFVEEFEALSSNHQIVVISAVFLIWASSNLQKPTVRMKLKSLR